MNNLTLERFQKIIDNLKNGIKITEEVKYIFNEIKSDDGKIQSFLLEFLNKIIDSKNYNVQIMGLINEFMSDRINIQDLSYKLFNEGKTGYSEFDDLYDKSLIVHDNLKRGLNDYIYPYKSPQFHHLNNDESILEKMIRVIFEFTRGDENNIRGVCFDYCLFLTALDIIKEKKTDFIIMCGIGTNGENSYFIARNNGLYDIIDPFNGIYTTFKDYDIRGVESVIIPDGENIIKPECEQNNSQTVYESWFNAKYGTR